MPTADAKLTFPKTCRLKSSQQIKDTVHQRDSVFCFPIKCFYSIHKSPTGAPCRVAFLVSKKRFRHAVDRNRVKRLLRESYRVHCQELSVPEKLSVNLCWMFVGVELPTYQQIESAAQQIFADLQDKLNE